uniref:Uncharacterized protein n=1 Tax=Anguilla anguilla TaxID=7936 RepID=A0A0E9PNH4_ANGAN
MLSNSRTTVISGFSYKCNLSVPPNRQFK